MEWEGRYKLVLLCAQAVMRGGHATSPLQHQYTYMAGGKLKVKVKVIGGCEPNMEIYIDSLPVNEKMNCN